VRPDLQAMVMELERPVFCTCRPSNWSQFLLNDCHMGGTIPSKRFRQRTKLAKKAHEDVVLDAGEVAN